MTPTTLSRIETLLLANGFYENEKNKYSCNVPLSELVGFLNTFNFELSNLGERERERVALKIIPNSVVDLRVEVSVTPKEESDYFLFAVVAVCVGAMAFLVAVSF